VQFAGCKPFYERRKYLGNALMPSQNTK
jgi:hypothetical protein